MSRSAAPSVFAENAWKPDSLGDLRLQLDLQNGAEGLSLPPSILRLHQWMGPATKYCAMEPAGDLPSSTSTVRSIDAILS